MTRCRHLYTVQYYVVFVLYRLYSSSTTVFSVFSRYIQQHATNLSLYRNPQTITTNSMTIFSLDFPSNNINNNNRPRHQTKSGMIATNVYHTGLTLSRVYLVLPCRVCRVSYIFTRKGAQAVSHKCPQSTTYKDDTPVIY